MSDAFHDGMQCDLTRSKVKVKVVSRWKLDIIPFLKAISSAIYNGYWQLTTDSRAQGHVISLNFRKW